MDKSHSEFCTNALGLGIEQFRSLPGLSRRTRSLLPARVSTQPREILSNVSHMRGSGSRKEHVFRRLVKCVTNTTLSTTGSLCAITHKLNAVGMNWGAKFVAGTRRDSRRLPHTFTSSWQSGFLSGVSAGKVGGSCVGSAALIRHRVRTRHVASQLCCARTGAGAARRALCVTMHQRDQPAWIATCMVALRA